MEAVQKKSGVHIQNQIRNNAEELRNTLTDLYNWEKEMKDKEHKLILEKESNDVRSLPIRSHVDAAEQPDVRTNPSVSQAKKVIANEVEEEKEDDEPISIKKAEAFKENGNKFVKHGEYKKAILEYTAAIDAFDGDPKFYTNRALCFLKLEKYDECIEDCNRAIEIDNSNVKAYYRRMQAKECLGFNTQALKDCGTLLMIDPKNSDGKASFQRINQRLKRTGAIPKGYPLGESNLLRDGPNFSPLRSNMMEILPANKPSYARSKKPLKKVPIIDVIGPKDGKNFENSNIQISDEVIDKLFNGECGSYEEVKKSATAEKTKAPEVEKDSNKASPEKTVSKPPKVSKLEAELASGLKDRPLPPPPTSTAQFHCNWKELSAEQKYQYLKSIPIPQLNKILGAGFDSETLTDMLMLFKEFYIPNDEDPCYPLAEICKHDRLSILSLLLSTDDTTALSFVLNYINKNNGNADHISLIKKTFNLE